MINDTFGDDGMKKGKFIVFEGLDGSGKGTQTALLEKHIKQSGGKVYLTAEPTIFSTGGMIRDALGGFTDRDAYELSAMFLTVFLARRRVRKTSSATIEATATRQTISSSETGEAAYCDRT